MMFHFSYKTQKVLLIYFVIIDITVLHDDFVCIWIRTDYHGDDIIDFDGSTDKRNKILGHWGGMIISIDGMLKSTSGCVACTMYDMNISGPPPSLRFSLYSWHWRRRQRAWTVSQDSKPGTKSELAPLCSASSSTCYTPPRLQLGSETDLTLLCCTL